MLAIPSIISKICQMCGNEVVGWASQSPAAVACKVQAIACVCLFVGSIPSLLLAMPPGSAKIFQAYSDGIVAAHDLVVRLAGGACTSDSRHAVSSPWMESAGDQNVRKKQETSGW